jgi:hypothetical protein
MACATQCPTVHAASVAGRTDVSLARSAPTPLRVTGRVPGVGSSRTVSRPDTSPPVSAKALWWSLHGFGLNRVSGAGSSHSRTPGHPPEPHSCEAALRDSRALSWVASGEAAKSASVGQQGRGTTPAARYRRTGTITCIRRFRRFCGFRVTSTSSRASNCVHSSRGLAPPRAALLWLGAGVPL